MLEMLRTICDWIDRKLVFVCLVSSNHDGEEDNHCLLTMLSNVGYQSTLSPPHLLFDEVRRWKGIEVACALSGFDTLFQSLNFV